MPGTVEYAGYHARSAPPSRGMAYSALRRIYRFVVDRVLYDTLLFPYGVIRHRALLKTADRTQSHTYTCFYRSPAQLRALVGPVVDYVTEKGEEARPLSILVFACSNGAEAYTIASELLAARPDLRFAISASDLHQQMVDKGISATYSRDEVWHSPHITNEFVERTFEQVGEKYIVRPHIRGRVSFSRASLLDENLPRAFEPADIVIAQNVLFHLDPQSARSAFKNLVGVLRSRAALLIEGADQDLKCEMTEAAGLTPLEFNCREIYQQSRAHIPRAWWRHYYGAEPWFPLRSKRFFRYSSIFLKGA